MGRIGETLIDNPLTHNTASTEWHQRVYTAEKKEQENNKGQVNALVKLGTSKNANPNTHPRPEPHENNEVIGSRSRRSRVQETSESQPSIHRADSREHELSY